MEIIPHNSDMVTAAITKAEKLGSIRNSILKVLVKNNKFLDSYLGKIYRD